MALTHSGLKCTVTIAYYSCVEGITLVKNHEKVRAVNAISLHIDDGGIFEPFEQDNAKKNNDVAHYFHTLQPIEGEIKILGCDGERRGNGVRKFIGCLQKKVGLIYIAQKKFHKNMIFSNANLLCRFSFKACEK